MAKTNWQYNEIVKPEDMNAMGQEINEALQKARGAIPATEKGQANGVAKLDANGKVLDGSGNVIDGQVRSINSRKGDVTLNSNDVGLGNVQNYGIASQTEAEEGLVNNKYMTPLRTKQLVDKFAETPSGAQEKVNTLKNSEVEPLKTRVTTVETTINQLANEISQKVNRTEFESLQIGGRNLLQNTDFHGGRVKIPWGWNTWDYAGSAINGDVSIEQDPVFGKFFRVITTVANPNRYVYLDLTASGVNLRNSLFIIGQTYTVSLYIRTSVDTTQSQIYIEGVSEGQNFQTKAGVWKKVTHTFTLNNLNPNNRFTTGVRIRDLLPAGTTIDICQLKLEFGNKATDWTPAPEDVDEQINSHASRTDNPHNVTKAQVGLGSVENYGIATQAEAEAGTANNKYMTPLRTKQLVDKFAETPAGAQAKANQAEANAKAASAPISHVGSGGSAHAVATQSMAGFMSAADKAKLDGIQSGAEVNQNAFSNVKVGSTTISADSKTDILELVAGSNIILTPDATNDKITIAANVPVTSVNGKTGAVNLTAADVGAETPDGVQAKLDALHYYFYDLITSTQTLWTGAAYPNSNQTITPLKTLSQCKTGWVLVWSDYDPGVGTNDYQFVVSFVPKAFVLNFWNGKDILFNVPSNFNSSTSAYVLKRLFIYNDKIVGHDDNGSSTNSSNDACLRAIFEY